MRDESDECVSVYRSSKGVTRVSYVDARRGGFESGARSMSNVYSI